MESFKSTDTPQLYSIYSQMLKKLFSILATLSLLTACFFLSSCTVSQSGWKDNNNLYQEFLQQEYATGKVREDIIIKMGKPTATFVWNSETGWPTVMDEYLTANLKRQDQEEFESTNRIDVYNRFLARYENHSGNHGRYVDYLFYDVDDEIIFVHRRKID